MERRKGLDIVSEQELAGRTALVTGGSRGIGRACCAALARAGARVAVNYHSSPSAAEQTVATIERAGGEAAAFGADVADSQAVDALVERVGAELGPVDLLVNNAGIFEFVPHEEATLEIWNRTLQTNVTSAYLLTWAVKQGMIERGFGRIVNMASISALRARQYSIAYSVSKAGLVALTRSTAEAFGPHNIRVNAVAPGLIATEILDDVDQGTLDRLIDATPMGRIGQVEEVAELVLFLLSERSSFTTGQTLVTSGGRVMLP